LLGIGPGTGAYVQGYQNATQFYVIGHTTQNPEIMVVTDSAFTNIFTVGTLTGTRAKGVLDVTQFSVWAYSGQTNAQAVFKVLDNAVSDIFQVWNSGEIQTNCGNNATCLNIFGGTNSSGIQITLNGVVCFQVTNAQTWASGGLIVGAGPGSFGRIQQGTADGTIKLSDNAGTSFTALQFGGTTASFPSIRRSSTALLIKLADDSAFSGLTPGFVTPTQGTITAAQPGVDHTVTWNNAGVTFTAIKSNVTSTASAAASLLIDLQLATVSQFKVTKAGAVTATGLLTAVGATLTATATITPAVNTNALTVTGYSLTGSDASSLVSFAGTWNTSGVPTAILLNITNTASDAASLLFDLQMSSVSQFKVSKAGAVTALGLLTAVGATLSATATVTPAVNTNALAVTGFSLTGSDASSLVSLAGTWNTTGAPTAIKLNITNTASDAASLLLDLQIGGSSLFLVNKLGTAIGNNFLVTPTTLTFAATTDIDMTLAGDRTLALTGDITFTTSNRAAGRGIKIKILADGSTRNFTFPAWIFLGTAPTSIAANKTAILSIQAYSTTDASIVAAYSVQA
jgi:hypothetical protein